METEVISGQRKPTVTTAIMGVSLCVTVAEDSANTRRPSGCRAVKASALRAAARGWNPTFALGAFSRSFVVCWLVGCLTSQQHAIVSLERNCTDNCTCCHTETEVADETFYLTQSQYTDTGPTSPSADPIVSGAWKGSHWSANFEVTGMTRPGKVPSQVGFEPRTFRS